MKLNRKLIVQLLLAIFCVSLVGCASRDVEPLGNGYQEVTYTQNSISEPSAHRISLQYRNTNGKQTMIWPSLWGVREVIKSDVALFVGNVASESPQSDNLRATEPRLFAVKASGPPLDITEEILWRWSKNSGKDFSEALKTASVSYVEEKDNSLEFHFATWPPTLPSIVTRWDWNGILDIMREVKEKGVARKDRVWGATYIEKEFKQEVQKRAAAIGNQ
jgi:hypothetical protein